MLKKANPLCHLHEYGTKPNPNYPDQYQVYTVWTGAKRTDIQASILSVKSSNFLLQLISTEVEGVGGKQFTHNLLNTFDLDMSRMAIFDYRYISRFNFFLSLAFNQSQYYPIWTILFYISIELKPQSLTSFLQLRRIEDIRSFHDDWSWGIFQVQDDLSCDWWSDYQATNWKL